jgi:hypothetical protein
MLSIGIIRLQPPEDVPTTPTFSSPDFFCSEAGSELFIDPAKPRFTSGIGFVGAVPTRDYE